MDDAELVRQVLQGNLAAYGRLVERYTAQVAALCRAHVRHQDAVEDLTQDTFLRGLDKLAGLREPAAFGYWLYAIARNLCREWLADPQRRNVSLSTNPPEVRDRAADEPGGRTDRFRALRECLRHLPEDLRETLEIYYSGGRITYQELAERLGVSFGLINQRLTRARRLLRACLEREGPTTS
jgi:RNA polymerase sigma-70 factor (ECF subfamily)